LNRTIKLFNIQSILNGKVGEMELSYSWFKDHIAFILNYWKEAVDYENGGIFFLSNHYTGELEKTGEKSVLMHVRQLYNYSVGSLYNVADSEKIAGHLFHTLDSVFQKHQGCYVTNHPYLGGFTKRITAYDQFYIVTGLAKYAAVFKDKKAYQRTKEHFLFTRRFFGDGSFSERGCFDSYDKKTGVFGIKTENAMLHHFEACINLLAAAQSVFNREDFEKEAHEISRIIEESNSLFFNRIYDKEKRIVRKFFENNMQPYKYQDRHPVTIAHALEWMGFFFEAQILLTKSFLKKEIQELTETTFLRGYHNSGCFLNDFFLEEGRCMATSVFWGQVEAVLGALYAYHLYKDIQYRNMADNLIKFYKENFVDDKDGGIFSGVTDDKIVFQRIKAFAYKCDHHSIRMCEKILQYKLLD
jgi:mannose/cellobiose epimerase-like protein (N-acyl-D-glucosamine 2-epimerase family)